MAKPTDPSKQLKQLQKLQKQTTKQLKQLNKAQAAAAKEAEGPREQSQLGKLFGAVTGAFAETANEMRNNFAPDAEARQKQGQSSTIVADQILNAVRGSQHGLGTQDDGHSFANAPVLPPQLEGDGPPNPLFEKPVWGYLTQPGPARPKTQLDCFFNPSALAEIHGYMKGWEIEADYPYTAAIAAAEASNDALLNTFKSVLENLPQLYGAVGFGPRNIQDDIDQMDADLTDLLNDNPKLIAIGPVGFDLHFSPHTVTEQSEQFLRQLEIAADFGLPVFLTQTKALNKLIETLDEAPLKPQHLILVDVPKSVDEAETIASWVKSHGIKVLVRAEVTYPDNAVYRDMVTKLPENSLLLASGSGLMAAQSRSGKTNTPASLSEIIGTLAKLRDADANQLLRTLNHTAHGIFGPPADES